MSSYNELIALINGCINRNGVQAITGRVLNGVLRAMVNQLGAGYAMGGVAHPTDDPGTPEAPVCYYASEVGTYTHFGNTQIVPGELALLCFDLTDGWYKETMYEGFESVQATIDGNVGTPAVNVTYVNGVLSFDFSNMKGNTGAAAGFGNVTAAVDGTSGTPGVSVQTDGPDTAKNIAFQFTGLKGETGVTSVIATVDNTSGTPQCAVSLNGQQLTLAFTGLKGAQGDTGSSVAYPFTIVNNLTTNDPTQALSAAMGVQLESEVSQLEAEVYGFTTEKNLPTSNWMTQTFGVSWGSNTDDIYIDVRNVIDATHKIKQFKIYRRASGTIRVYFLKKIDLSIVTYKEVTLGSVDEVKTFSLTLEDEYYANGPMYVGIWSSIVWGSLAGYSGDYPNSYTYSIANDVLTSVSTRAWGYGITIDEDTDGDIDKIDARLDKIEGELDGVFDKPRTLPNAEWIDGAFPTGGGGDSGLVYIDDRNVLASGEKVTEIRLKATSSGDVTFYLLSSAYAILATEVVAVVSGLNTIVPTFGESLYEAGCMVGVMSASSRIGLRTINAGEEKHTDRLKISTGVVTQGINYALGMDIQVEKAGELTEIQEDISVLKDDVSDLNDAVFETKILPSSTWLDGTFSVRGGGDAQYAFFDERTLIPAGVVPERVRMKATASNNITIYLIKASDYSILASETKSVVVGINDITPSFSASLYNVPTYIGVGSADSPIAMRDTNGTSETSYTDRLTIASGVISQKGRYIIALEVKYTALKTTHISQDLDEAIAQGGNDIVLGPYDYAVTSPITLVSGMTIRGSFGKTRLILTDGCQTAITASNADNIKISDLEIVGTCPDYSYEMNGIVAGTGYDLVETEANALALDYMGTEKGIYIYYCENVVIENVKINHIDGSAIRVNHTGMNYIKGLNAVNLFITNCYNGIYCENEHEFSQYTNWAVTLCMIGIYVASGNLIFTAGHATRCRVAMQFMTGTNHAHGVVNGVELKHNQIAGLLCKDVQYGEFFQGLYISYGKLITRDCTGLYFDDIITGNMHIDSTGTTGKNVISKLVKRNSGVVIDNQETLTIGETIALY